MSSELVSLTVSCVCVCLMGFWRWWSLSWQAYFALSVCVWCSLKSSRVHVCVSAVCLLTLRWVNRASASVCRLAAPEQASALVSEQVGAIETVSLSHPITVHNANVCVRLSAASHSQIWSKAARVSTTHVQFKSLFAGLQYFLFWFCGSSFCYFYITIHLFIKSRKCQIGSSLLLQNMWPTSFTTWSIPWAWWRCNPEKRSLGSISACLRTWYICKRTSIVSLTVWSAC